MSFTIHILVHKAVLFDSIARIRNVFYSSTNNITSLFRPVGSVFSTEIGLKLRSTARAQERIDVFIQLTVHGPEVSTAEQPQIIEKSLENIENHNYRKDYKQV